MKPEDYPRVRALFLGAVKLDPGARAAYLDRECEPALRAQVERMLANDEQVDAAFATGALPDVVADAGSAIAAMAHDTNAVAWLEGGDDLPLPSRFGRYTVTRLIGRGGMGAVYEAEQDDPRRKVALKMIRRDAVSDEMSRRFALEAHVLGVLQHPGIAQVYDARSDSTERDARPFFAMEYVDGMPITRFAAARDLSLSDRLALLADVMDAVHHAHRKGVIHRDLKPDNILVTAEGQPKILDFGVAHAADAALRVNTLQTHAGQIIGTLAYMSPEQAAGREGEIDTRSDVYSLGVIGYELVAGKRPYDVQGHGIADAIRVIAEEDPSRLSTLRREAHGDVETIFEKALRKEPDERYASVAAFAADVRRYLAHEPILARAPSTVYQLKKFASRHRGVVAAAGVAFLALVAGLIVSLDQARRAIDARDLEREARKEAENENEISRAVTDFLLRDVLFAVNPRRKGQGREAKVIDTLDRASANIGAAFADKPVVHAELRLILGQTYWALGAFEESAPHLEKSVALRRECLGPDHPELGRSLCVLGMLQKDRGDYAAAKKTLEESRAIYAELPPEQVPERASTLHNLGEVLMHQGDYDEAETLISEALKIHASRDDERESARTIATAINLVNVLLQREETLKAGAAMEELLPRAIEILGPEHPHVGTIYSNLSGVAQRRGDAAEMERLAKLSIDIQRKRFGARSKQVGLAMHNLGYSLLKIGQDERGERVLRDAVDILSEVYGRNNARTAMTVHVHGTALMKLGRYDEAETLIKEALAVTQRKRGAKHPFVAIILAELASLFEKKEQNEQAEKMHRRALAIAEAAYRPAHITPLTIRTRLIKLLERTGRTSEADAELKAALAIAEPLAETKPNFTVLILATMVRIARERGDTATAAAHLERAERLFAKSPLKRPGLQRSLSEERAKLGGGEAR